MLQVGVALLVPVGRCLDFGFEVCYVFVHVNIVNLSHSEAELAVIKVGD